MRQDSSESKLYYTGGEWTKRGWVAALTPHGRIAVGPDPWFCSCVVGDLGYMSAYAWCQNCCGYGFMPIPWSELR